METHTQNYLAMQDEERSIWCGILKFRLVVEGKEYEGGMSWVRWRKTTRLIAESEGESLLLLCQSRLYSIPATPPPYHPITAYSLFPIPYSHSISLHSLTRAAHFHFCIL
ncbi:hypothetical protein VNO80_09593 [Phaseolus coccineus]|uniref:Uncharacterized protein n=1 Tax=Phaseolus coccineus TaxID=3886 RepID=A0AAN9RIK0_PHACN